MTDRLRLVLNDHNPDEIKGTDGYLGLNRRLDDVENTIAAAKVVQSKVTNLYAIELGNEPNCELKHTNLDQVLMFQSSNRATPSPTGQPGQPQRTQHRRSPGRHP